MVPIGLDISDIIDEFSQLAGKSEEFSSFILDRVVDSYMFEWQEMVKNELHGTRKEYLNSMFTERIDNRNAVIGLMPSESRLALMIEDGASSWDMKDGFSKSPKKHDKKDGGWYLTIPFRSATNEAIGESMAFTNKMPTEVQKVVKSKKGAVTLQDLPSQYQKIGINKTSGYTHKNNIYEGLHRKQGGSSKKENRGIYMNFRRVSDKSDDGVFVHPGFEAKHFMEKTINGLNISNILDIATDDFLKQL